MMRVLSIALLLVLLAALAARSTRAPGSQGVEPSSVVRMAPRAAPAEAFVSERAVVPAASASLAADANVRVTVLYTGSARPVRRATVFIGPPETEGRTDEEGVALFEIPEGSTLKYARVNASDGSDPLVRSSRLFEQLVSSGLNEIAVEVERGIDLRGIVREAATGRVLASAHVQYYQTRELKQVECGPDGAFVCVAVHTEPAHALGLRIECDGFLPAQLELAPAHLQRDAAPLDVRLEKGIVVSGRILDSDRKPVAGAFLQLYTPANFQTTSDELGQFEFGGIEPTEKATIFSQVQSWSRPPILERAFELGAIRASRFDLELVVPLALEVQVFAELADGTKLDPGGFEVDWGDGFLRDVWLLGPEIFLGPKELQSRVLPRGPELDLVVTAHGPGTDDRNAILRGKAHVHTDRTVNNPLEVHVRLDEPGRLEIPPVPAGAPEIRLGEDTNLLGAFDVQLLDADSGKPIQGENSVVWSRGFTEPIFDWLTPGPDGWVRFWNPIGKTHLFLHYTQCSGEQFEIVIPRTGYAKAEWRLRSKL